MRVSFRRLMKSTLYRLSLATPRWVGILLAVLVEVIFRVKVLICSLPEFVARTESASNPLPVFFPVRCFAEVVGPGEQKHLLCPVRALHFYPDGARGSFHPRSLLVSVKNPSLPLSKNALSYFLREVIKESDALLDCPGHQSDNRMHSIRGAST